MSTRNRGSYSSYSGRRSGGASLLRTFGLVLLLGAFSFLLGFFVLSRFVPGGRGPESQPAVVPKGDDSSNRGNTEASNPAPPVRQIETPAVHPPDRSASTAAHAPDPVPSIDPVDDEKTQQPANLDGTSSSSGDAGKSSAEASSAGNGGANSSPTLEAASPAPDASTTHHRRKRRRRRTTQSTTAATDAKSTASPPEKKTPPEEATQAPTKLDDSGASKTDQSKSGDNNSGDNN